MPHYDFKKDLPIAQKTEQQVADLFNENVKDLIFLEHCNNSDYDLKFKYHNREITFEIKEDFTCEKTGNIGVEYECRGKLSGISISKAVYYIYKIHRPDGKIGLYIIHTNKLKKMIEDKLWFRKVIGGDKGSNSKNYLFRLDVIEEKFKLLKFLEN
jgi:hypothetical protein